MWTFSTRSLASLTHRALLRGVTCDSLIHICFHIVIVHAVERSHVGAIFAMAAVLVVHLCFALFSIAVTMFFCGPPMPAIAEALIAFLRRCLRLIE